MYKFITILKQLQQLFDMNTKQIPKKIKRLLSSNRKDQRGQKGSSCGLIILALDGVRLQYC